ncbi:MAG TPA: methyl-accepting chemotaxis protein [bacterium]
MTFQQTLQNIKKHLTAPTTIQAKILALIASIGIILSLLLAYYSPNQSQKLGRDILKNDAQFITDLLAENLSLGMQTADIDDGAALNQTLGLFKAKKNEKWEAITDIAVFDKNGLFVTGLRNRTDSSTLLTSISETAIQEFKQSIRMTSPMRDIDSTLVGYVRIDYSKKYLNYKIGRNSLSAALISILVLLVTSFLGFLVSHEVTGRIRKAVDVMDDIAQGQGDLTKRLSIHSNDEVGQLQTRINAFINTIHDLVASVKWNTDLVSHAANAISSTSSQMAEGAGKQAERAIEAANTVERVSSSIGQNIRHATETTRMTEEATLIAREGTDAMQTVLKGMQRIVECTQDIGKLVHSLSKRTEKIDEIIHIIDDIAIQTNLLAINASIEATRAGEDGKGFMVIADEIHRLSDQTIQSTQVVVETVKTIQTDIVKATQAMEETEDNVSKGQRSTKVTEEVLNRVVHAVRTSMEMMKSISASFAEQGAGVREVASCVDDISQITKQSSSGAMAVALASKEMKLQTDSLHEALDHFKLKNDSSPPSEKQAG